MGNIKTEKEIEIMRESGKILAEILKKLAINVFGLDYFHCVESNSNRQCAG